MANHYLINGDSTTLSPSDVASCDVMIVDPPYSEKVHKSAVSVTGSGGELYNTRKREFGFDSCAILGRSYVGFELDPAWATFARQRIEAFKTSGALSDRDKDRLGRYTEERGKRK